jgi:8-oxo-dGTP pyrophosphatase MutT (NUDIX family)
VSREKGIHKIETHAACICIKEMKKDELKILIGKRTPSRNLFPGYWECGGGQVHTGEDFENAAIRQIKDEFGLDIKIEYTTGVYKIQTAGKIIPGIRFIAKPINENQDVILNPDEFVEYKWITEDELNRYNFIPTLKEDVKKALELYKKIKQSPSLHP